MTILETTRGALVDDSSRRPPDLVSDSGSRSWSVCGRNFVVSVTQLQADDPLREDDVHDEHIVLVPGDAVVSVEHDTAASLLVSQPSLVVVPAGTSTLCATSPTTVARVFTSRCVTQMARANNYSAGFDPRTSPLPEPVADGTDHIRVYPLRDFPEEPGRLGTIFRTNSLMVNWFPVQSGPRDTEQLSPHAHADFEQLSLTLAGTFVHHLRVPWTPRMSEWRHDKHATVGSPSMTLIPPTVVHTTRAVGAGLHTLIDVFAPPRDDFDAKGWVVNAGDYPTTRP